MLMLAASCLTLLHVRVFIRKLDVHKNIMGAFFFLVEAVKIEIKQQPDGIEPFIYSQSGSFHFVFLLFSFLPSTHT